MARLIDADQAVAEAERLLELYNLAMAGAETNREINHIFKRQELFKAVRAVVNTCPTIDLVKHGEWINIDAKFENMYVAHQCSICKSEFLGDASNFCPRCGAKMGGEHNVPSD